MVQGLTPHYFQPTFFSKTGRYLWVSAGFLERRIPGKNGPGVDSPFFSTFFSKTGRYLWVSAGFLERRIPGKNGPGVDSPLFSTNVLFKDRPLSLGFCRFSGKKDSWKEWSRG